MLRLIEGFDHVGAAGQAVGNIQSAGWTVGGSLAGGSNLMAGRYGAPGLAVGVVTNNYLFHKRLAAGFDEVWAGFAAYGGGKPGTNWFYIVNQAVSGLVSIGRNTSGFLELRNAAGTVVATSTYSWDSGNWHYYEVRVKCAGAAGSAEVWVDGIQVIAPVTGNFGTAGPTTNAAGVYFNITDGGGSGQWTTYIDDVYMLDTGVGVKITRLGECRIETIFPTADGAHTDFVPTTAGTHFDEVDDPGLPDGDTTVVQSNAVGARDSYVFADLAVATATIHGLGVKTVARKNDAGVRTIKHSIRQAGTTYDGPVTHTLGAAHACYQTCFDQDPLAVNWTLANVNADEFGVKVEA